MKIHSIPVKAKPRKLLAKWTVGSINFQSIDQSYVVRWMNQYTDYMLVMGMLDGGGLEAIEHIGFDKLCNLAA
ncbi:unnamed protein product, partial [marine sediment metagenome]